MKPRLYGPLLLSLFLLLAACRSAAEETAALPTLATTAVAVQPGAVESITPPPTPPIATLPVTAVPSTPSPTPSPIWTPTSTPTPTATPTPVFLNEPADFGDDRNPLTGELVSDPTVLQRRPLAVKVSNYLSPDARPQSGLNDADIVFEYLAEGNITRFTAIFYSRAPAEIGPVRSARLIDLEILGMLDAAFVSSGGSAGVMSFVNSSPYASLFLRGGAGYYRTGENKPFEHTLYARPNPFWEILTERGRNNAPNLGRNLIFSSEPPPGDNSAQQIEFSYRFETISWAYDADLGLYGRLADNEIMIDANDEEQITTANLIILYAPHQLDPATCAILDENNSCEEISMRINLVGSGTVIIFRDGRRYDGVWRRNHARDMLAFYDSAGQPIPLQIGKTWLHVLPYWLSRSVEVIP